MDLKFKIDLSDLLLPYIKNLLDCGVMEIRDVDEGDTPFLYASGWSGPGYLMFKASVSHPFFKGLTLLEAVKIAAKVPKTSFVAGNVTGGVIPGWLISNYLEMLLGHPVQFMYVSGTRDLEEAKKRPIMVINKAVLEELAQNIADATISTLFWDRSKDAEPGIHFVAGGAPGGMPLAHRVSEILSLRLFRHIPFVYVREKQKAGGKKELITGIQNNPFFKPGMIGLAIGDKMAESDDGIKHVMDALEKTGFGSVSLHEASRDNQLSEFPRARFENYESALQTTWAPDFLPDQAEGIVMEELSNFAHSAITSAKVLEIKYGLNVPNAGSLLFYNQPKAIMDLEKEGMDMICLITLQEFLRVARQFGTHYTKLIKAYRKYLADPIGWNQERGIERVEKGGTI